ncbi:MAG: phosphatase PAP2 family protein [Bacteroidota bacterium]|nr:phosphatase PAP2 family protein [Bacteroidota bacterium]
MKNRPLLRYVLVMAAVYACWVVLYFLTARIGAQRGPAFDAAIGLDFRIPFLPVFQYVYALCYVIPLGVFLVSTEPAWLRRAYTVFIAINAAAFLVFVIFPVEGPPREETIRQGVNLLQWIHRVDTRYNAFPSLHVANPTLVALLSHERHGFTRRTFFFTVVALCIAAATLFTKQHYVLDVAAGALLAVLVHRIFRRIWPVRR